jgi:hypothetical protein
LQYRVGTFELVIGKNTLGPVIAEAAIGPTKEEKDDGDHQYGVASRGPAVFMPVVVVRMRVSLAMVVVMMMMRVVVIAVVLVMFVIVMMVLVIVVMMFMIVACLIAGFLPERERANCDQDEERDSADEYGRKELRSKDVFELRFPVRPGKSVHENCHRTQCPTSRYRAKLVEVIGAVAGMFVVVCHCRNLMKQGPPSRRSTRAAV